MGYRKAVQVSKARQLRLDAHVTSICVGVQYVCVSLELSDSCVIKLVPIDQFVESDATLITSVRYNMADIASWNLIYM